MDTRMGQHVEEIVQQRPSPDTCHHNVVTQVASDLLLCFSCDATISSKFFYERDTYFWDERYLCWVHVPKRELTRGLLEDLLGCAISDWQWVWIKHRGIKAV